MPHWCNFSELLFTQHRDYNKLQLQQTLISCAKTSRVDIRRKSWITLASWHFPTLTPSISQLPSDSAHNTSLINRGIMSGPKSVMAGQTSQSLCSPPMVVEHSPVIVVWGYVEPRLLRLLICVLFRAYSWSLSLAMMVLIRLIWEWTKTRLGNCLASIKLKAMYLELK